MEGDSVLEIDPLLVAPLVPYNTVGVFMAAILGASGVGTLLILPALMRYLEPLLFPATRVCRITCRCGTCIVTAAVGAATVAINIKSVVNAGWASLTAASVAAVLVAGGWCWLMSRRQSRVPPTKKD